MNAKWVKPALILSTVIILLFNGILPVLALTTLWETPIILDNSPGAGYGTSMAVVNGRPAVAYFDAGPGNLRYIRANNPDGTHWSDPFVVDNSFGAGLFPSMAVVNGFPSITYYDDTNGVLMYVRANDVNGTTWGTPVVVDPIAPSGIDPSLTIINGRPAISYVNLFGAVRYVRANDANGTAWGIPVDVFFTFGMGYDTSLVVVNGFPAISFFDDGLEELFYIRATDANGTVWGPPQTLESNLGIWGGYSSMAIVNGNPAISYFDDNIGVLKFIRANDSIGSAWGAPLIPDNTPGAGFDTSLAVIDGTPAISYYAFVEGTLRYVQANDANGTDWTAPQVLDSADDVGEYSSLVMVNGQPAISYFDYNNGHLRYIRGVEEEDPAMLPATGFTPGQVTSLPAQPASKQYSPLGDLWLEVPDLGVQAAISGVPRTVDNWDVSWLGNDIGWLNGTAFPTHAGNTVLTAHNYNSYGQPGPFANLESLTWGDKVTIHAYGMTYTYEVRSVESLVSPNDVSAITQHEEHDWITLVTCRGYDAETDSYTYRTVVRAVLVDAK